MVLKITISTYTNEIYDSYLDSGLNHVGNITFCVPTDVVKWGLKYTINLDYSDEKIRESLSGSTENCIVVIMEEVSKYRIILRDDIINDILYT